MHPDLFHSFLPLWDFLELMQSILILFKWFHSKQCTSQPPHISHGKWNYCPRRGSINLDCIKSLLSWKLVFTTLGFLFLQYHWISRKPILNHSFLSAQQRPIMAVIFQLLFFTNVTWCWNIWAVRNKKDSIFSTFPRGRRTAVAWVLIQMNTAV